MPDSSLDRHTSQDLGQFWKSWFKDPKLIGAVAPSGRALAKLMSAGLGPGARVIELGAGTGTVTEALLATGVRPEDLYLLERNEAFFDILSRRFPRSPLIAADALELRERFAGELGTFDFVVSGLPLLLFEPARKRGSSSRSSPCSGRAALISSSRMAYVARSIAKIATASSSNASCSAGRR